MTIRATYSNGVFEPVDPCDLEEGQRVTVTVDVPQQQAAQPTGGHSSTDGEANAEVERRRDDAERRILEAGRITFNSGGRKITREGIYSGPRFR